MKSMFGNTIKVALFGESHGECIGAVLNGIAAGIPVDLEYINQKMALRRPQGAISTARHEPDPLRFVSGVYNGFTTGSPIGVIIPNSDTKSGDYSPETAELLRPSHADFVAYEKYGGFQDPRGGGHFSGRITAPLVAIGALCQQILERHSIVIGTHISRCGDICDIGFEDCDGVLLRGQIEELSKKLFPVLDEPRGTEMQEYIKDAAASEDSVGGALETAICGLPTGVGEPFFDSVESVLSHLLFSVPGVKGVEFGLGFGYSYMLGSEANDPFTADEQGHIKTKTNFSGGINGGITNGMPVVFRTAMRPTPSIASPQETVNYKTRANEHLEIKGRHDPAIIHRARVVIDSVTAIGLLDLLTERQGTLWMSGAFSD